LARAGVDHYDVVMSLVVRIRALIAASPHHRIVLPRSPATPVPLIWLDPEDADAWAGYPELDDVADELGAYLPLAEAAVSADDRRCVVVAREPPHAVAVFDDGFHEIAGSLDALFAALLGADQPSPAAVLDAATTAADARLDAGDPAGAIAALTPALAGFPAAPTGREPSPLAELVAAAWTDLGVARHVAGDDTAAAEAYTIAAAWGSEPARCNLLELAVQASRWADARGLAETLLASWKAPDELNELRATYARVLAELGDHAAAATLGVEHAGYLRWLAGDERPRAEALQAAFLAQLDDIVDASPGCAPAVAAIRPAIAAPLPAEGEISADDIAAVLEAIAETKALRVRSMLSARPALLDLPEVTAAIAGTPDTSRGAQIRALAEELTRKK
jgi:hypothetical protein